MLRQGNWHASWLWEWLWWLSFRICHFLPLVLIQHPRTDIIIHTTQKYENEKIFNFWAFVPTPICTCASPEVICYPTGDARHCTLASLWNMKKPTNILDMRQPWKRSANHFLVYAVSAAYEGRWPVVSLVASSSNWQCTADVFITAWATHGGTKSLTWVVQSDSSVETDRLPPLVDARPYNPNNSVTVVWS